MTKLHPKKTTQCWTIFRAGKLIQYFFLCEFLNGKSMSYVSSSCQPMVDLQSYFFCSALHSRLRTAQKEVKRNGQDPLSALTSEQHIPVSESSRMEK